MIDVQSQLAAHPDLDARGPSQLARGLKGSAILAIAGEVAALRATGAPVANFTVGDFSPEVFPVPGVLVERIRHHLEAGRTNYPPAVGVPELRDAVLSFYREALGLDYPDGSVQIGSGARPPIFAAFSTLVDPGDLVLYPVPSWNVGYYVQLNGAVGVPLVTRPEHGFMPTVEDVLPRLREARLLVLNSPLNPAGTVVDAAALRGICEAIVEENRRREADGERPLFLLYDQVYWQLTFGDAVHVTPPGLVPEMAAYTVLVDAVSKCWAATGLRIGWCVAPPWLVKKMTALVGHMGAWAARPEQLATAELLADPQQVAPFLTEFRAAIRERLTVLQEGLAAMRDEGLPVDLLDAEGAIYLTARFDLVGRTLKDGTTLATDEDVRRLLLQRAGVAVVPFTAFGYPEGSGWLRLSVGAVEVEECRAALGRIREALAILL